MSPAARVTLASLLSEKSLERVPASPDVCHHLLDQSGNHRRTAAADLRFVRHGAEYRAESVSIDDARDAIDIGQDLLVKVAPRVGQILQSAS